MKQDTAAQNFGLWIGAVYVLIGIIGFFVTSGVDFAGSKGKNLFGVFEINPLHNIVHLITGIALIIGFGSALGARAINSILGIVFVVLGIVGFALSDSTSNVFALNLGDNLLHLVTGVGALTLGRSIGTQSAAT